MRFTYPEVAKQFDFEMCAGGCWLSASVHQHGAAHDKRIHWRDRRWSHRGLWRFLQLMSLAVVQKVGDGDEAIESIWVIDIMAEDMAKELGVRIPKKLVNIDRRELAWQAHKEGITLSKPAQRWVNRRHT